MEIKIDLKRRRVFKVRGGKAGGVGEGRGGEGRGLKKKKNVKDLKKIIVKDDNNKNVNFKQK